MGRNYYESIKDEDRIKNLTEKLGLKFNYTTGRYDSDKSVKVTEDMLVEKKFYFPFGSINGDFICSNLNFRTDSIKTKRAEYESGFSNLQETDKFENDEPLFSIEKENVYNVKKEISDEKTIKFYALTELQKVLCAIKTKTIEYFNGFFDLIEDKTITVKRRDTLNNVKKVRVKENDEFLWNEQKVADMVEITVSPLPIYVTRKFDISHNNINVGKFLDRSITLPEKTESLNLSFNKITYFYDEFLPDNFDGSLDISNNEIVSFVSKHSGKRIRDLYGDFCCSNNKLTNLDGVPENIYGDFDCSHNDLHGIKTWPGFVGGSYDCSYCNLDYNYFIQNCIFGDFIYSGNIGFTTPIKYVFGDCIFSDSREIFSKLKDYIVYNVGGDFVITKNFEEEKDISLFDFGNIPDFIGGKIDIEYEIWKELLSRDVTEFYGKFNNKVEFCSERVSFSRMCNYVLSYLRIIKITDTVFKDFVFFTDQFCKRVLVRDIKEEDIPEIFSRIETYKEKNIKKYEKFDPYIEWEKCLDLYNNGEYDSSVLKKIGKYVFEKTGKSKQSDSSPISNISAASEMVALSETDENRIE